MSQLTLKTPSTGQTGSGPLAWLSRAGFGVITLLAIALFGWANPVFLTFDNWANLLQGSAILLIVAMAMTLIVSAGAIDLSVGVALDFGAAFALVALKTWHLPWQAAVGCALLGGVIIGLLNAFLILVCQIRPFLATLGTWFIASSAERIYTVGGVILSANLRQFTPLAGQAYLMDAIAAVFIGTAFNRLGRVSIAGTLGGVLFLAIIDNGLNLMGLNYLVKDALVGVILVVALALSFWQARLRQTHR